MRSLFSTGHHNDDGNPQSALDGDRSHGSLGKYSWSGEQPPGKAAGGGQQSSTGLMMKLCSHLLPAGIDAGDSSLTPALVQNKGSNQSNLEWDNNDPNKPGYVVHRLTSSQLAIVEGAFEEVVATLERTSERGVRNGQQSSSKNDDKLNFKRDLEETGLVLDREERRYESERSR